MRLPRVRVTVRRMMLAVAIVALTLEGSIVWNRYTYCHHRAAMLTAQVAYLRGIAAKAPSPKAVIRGFVIELRPGDRRDDHGADRLLGDARAEGGARIAPPLVATRARPSLCEMDSFGRER